MIDLYSGLGGASEAFLQAGWRVLRIEKNILLKDVPNTEIVDATKIDLPTVPPAGIDLLWASPPCREFSLAFAAPRSKAQRSGEDFQPDMTLAKLAKKWIDAIKPRYWCVENVVGSREYFEPIFGPPRQIVGSFVLYGNFPLIDMPRSFKHYKEKDDERLGRPLRSNVRALVPWELSEGLLWAIQNQKRLEDYL